MTTSRMTVRLLSALTLTLTGVCAHAGLDEPVARIAQDQLAFKSAPARVTHAAAFDRHELLTTDGVNVHEFVGRNGRVFAVTFNGPAMPDLKVLLGGRFNESAAAVHPSPSTHKVYTHSSRTLELSIVKLPRGFAGSAFVPGAIPAGVTARDLQ